MLVSIIVPCYNEEAALPYFLKEIKHESGERHVTQNVVLIAENEKAKKAETTSHCRQQCSACCSNSLNGGKCDALNKNMVH